jgi:lipid-A-disaccharide synthase
MSKKFFLIAGEASGDYHGSQLVTELKKEFPDAQFQGLGGAQMAACGVSLLHDLTREAVLGLGDVLRKYFLFRKLFNQALKAVETFRPDAIILIDYPGFNLRFAKKIAKRIPVIYYISPQIWAWAGNRIHEIKKNVNHMLVFFDFEKEIYEQAGVPVTWVGHPLVGQVKPSKLRTELREEWLGKQSDNIKAVALFPGSRETEVSRILPEMLKTAKLVAEQRKDTSFFLCESNTLSESLYDEILSDANLDFKVKKMRNRVYDIFFACDFGMVSSGTATLEAALASIPFVILYKTAWSTFFLGRRLVTIPFIGLVNVVAGRKIVPEFIQHEIKTETIAHEAKYLLDHQDLREKMILDLKGVQSKLGPDGAAHRAAAAIAELFSKKALAPDPLTV